jgi:hypothetical protein
MNKISMDDVDQFLLCKQRLRGDSKIDDIIQIVRDIGGLRATGSTGGSTGLLSAWAISAATSSSASGSTTNRPPMSRPGSWRSFHGSRRKSPPTTVASSERYGSDGAGKNGVEPLFAHPYYQQDKEKIGRTTRNVTEEFVDLLRKFPEWLQNPSVRAMVRQEQIPPRHKHPTDKTLHGIVLMRAVRAQTLGPHH